MEFFATNRYAIAYAGFVIAFVLYLIASSKVTKLQRKCSMLSNFAAEVRNIPVEDLESKTDLEKGFSLALDELKYLKGKASDVIYEIQKKK